MPNSTWNPIRSTGLADNAVEAPSRMHSRSRHMSPRHPSLGYMGTNFRFFVVGLAALLAGCSAVPSSISESEFRGGLPSAAITADPGSWAEDPSFPAPVPVAGWLDAGARFAVVLSGSSSCPDFPSSIEVLNAHHIKLDIGSHTAQACSADLAPRTYVIKTPGDVDVSNEVTLEFGETSVVLPPL